MRRLSAIAFIAAAVVALCVLPGVSRATEIVHACDSGNPDNIWAPFGYATPQCGNAGLFLSAEANIIVSGGAQGYTATPPAGLEIVGTSLVPQTPSEIPPTLQGGGEWESDYVWSGGNYTRFVSGSVCGARPGWGCGENGTSHIPPSFASPWFTIQLVCNGYPDCTDSATLTQPAPDLIVAETAQPSLSAAPGTLGSGSGWVRGSWPLGLTGDAPSGLCSISATLDSLGLGLTTSPQDVSQWKQCSATSLTGEIDTTKFANGADSFDATATSAAGDTATVDTTVNVDNTTPSVTLSGPTDVPAGSGPATMTATATAGPSGVGEIACNVDGTTQDFPQSGAPTTATATIGLAGLGAHTVNCLASDTATDPQGNPAWSPVATRGLTIRAPTAALAAFGRRVDRRICDRQLKQVRVPAGWHTIRWHGKKIRARLPAHTVKKRVRVCHERIERKRIVVYTTVHRHHHKVRVKRHRIVRVPVAPHMIRRGVRTVRFGHRTQLSGQLLTTTGQALAGQPITVMGALRNGNGVFRPLVVTTTNADGVWYAKIPRGPGRILEAAYGGTATTEPAISDQVRTIVHARVKLAPVTPAAVPWHGQILLRGTLPGGHLPHRGINVRLVYGLGHHSITYAVRQHVGAQRHSTFRARFRFGAGPARAHARFFFRVCTLPSPRYPFAVGCSGKRTVLVGGHPHAHRPNAQRRKAHRHAHHKRHRGRHRKRN